MRILTPIICSLALIFAVTVPVGAVRQKAKRPHQQAATSQAAGLIVQGAQSLAARDYASALDFFERAASADPDSADAFYRIGSTYYHRAFTETAADKADKMDARNAIDAFESALALDPALGEVSDPYMLYHGLAQCYEAEGRLTDALTAIKKSARLAHKNPMPYLYGARIRLKLNDAEKSAANLYYGVRRARRISKYPAVAKLVKTNPLFSGLLDSAKNKMILDTYDAVESGTLTEQEAQERIRGYQPYRDALTGIPARKPQELAPPYQDPEVLKLVSRADRAYKTQHYADAVQKYQAALSKDAAIGSLNKVNKSQILERIASSFRHLGRLDESIRIYQLAVQELPQNTSANYQLALTCAANGELGNAMTALNRALDSARSPESLRQTILMTRTDPELDALRDLPRYSDIMRSHAQRL